MSFMSQLHDLVESNEPETVGAALKGNVEHIHPYKTDKTRLLYVETKDEVNMLYITPLFMSDTRLSMNDVVTLLRRFLKGDLHDIRFDSTVHPTIFTFIASGNVFVFQTVPYFESSSEENSMYSLLRNATFLMLLPEDEEVDEDGSIYTYASVINESDDDAVMKMKTLIYKKNMSPFKFKFIVDCKESGVDLFGNVSENTTTYDLENFLQILSEINRDYTGCDFSKIKSIPAEVLVSEYMARGTQGFIEYYKI